MCLAGPPPGLTVQDISWLACPYLCQSSQHLPPNLPRPITIVKFLCSFLKTVVFVDICEAKHFFLFSSLPISWSTFLSVALIPYENPCIRESLSVSIYSTTFSSNNSLFSSVQSLSRVRLLRPHESHQASLSITNSRSLLKPMSIESVMPSNHLLLLSIYHNFINVSFIFSFSVRVQDLQCSLLWP